MGKEKGGFLTPKAIANRIKAKGMQKLRWYCQMCQKQCRDENGFKCHMMSESHQRQLLLFAEDPDQYIDTFSKDFKDGYTELLRRRFGTKRVQCNIVYQEYISERDHIHMNSTQWETLTDFVKWLGKEGFCTVDYTEKGWFVQHIDREPDTIKKQEAVRVKEKMALDDDERAARHIQEQIERAAQQAGRAPTDAEYTDLQRGDDEEKVTINMSAVAKKEDSMKVKTVENPFKVPAARSDEAGTSTSTLQRQASKKPQVGQKRKSALGEIMEFEENYKEKQNRKEYWLHEGVVVKVVSKKLGDKYYKKKAYVKSIQNLFGAVIKMLDSGDKLKVDQNHLETVIPAQGKTVMVVNGAYRGQTAMLDSINEKKFSCTVTLNTGPLTGRVLSNISYEDISKLYQPT